MTTGRRFRCRCCGVVLSAWFPVSNEPDGAMLLGHMTRAHPVKLRPFLDQMRITVDIMLVIVQAFEAVDAPERETP